MIIDTHIHLDDERYAGDLEAVLARAEAADVGRFVIPGADPSHLPRAVEIAERIGYLEETTIVSLCQLYDKPAVDKAPEFFARPLDSLPSLKGYARGLRFVSPPIFAKELAEILLKPEVGDDVKLCALDTLDGYNQRQARSAIPAPAWPVTSRPRCSAINALRGAARRIRTALDCFC